MTTKQPWEMTREEFRRAYPVKRSPYTNKGFRHPLVTGCAFSNAPGAYERARMEIIYRALQANKPVPGTVLSDYPGIFSNVKGL